MSDKALAEFFESGVQLIMDHRLAALDWSLSGDLGSDEASSPEEQDELMLRVRKLGQEVGWLQLVVPSDSFKAMTSEANIRLEGLSAAIDMLDDSGDDS